MYLSLGLNEHWADEKCEGHLMITGRRHNDGNCNEDIVIIMKLTIEIGMPMMMTAMTRMAIVLMIG